MGWTYTYDPTRKHFIANLTADDSWTREDGAEITRTCLKKCYRGAPWKGVLWSVWELTLIKEGQHARPLERYIMCHLLHYSRPRARLGMWGYKDMSARMHPYYYGCPLSYLSLAPFECAEWRARVKEYWERKRTRGRLKAISSRPRVYVARRSA